MTEQLATIYLITMLLLVIQNKYRPEPEIERGVYGAIFQSQKEILDENSHNTFILLGPHSVVASILSAQSAPPQMTFQR